MATVLYCMSVYHWRTFKKSALQLSEAYLTIIRTKYVMLTFKIYKETTSVKKNYIGDYRNMNDFIKKSLTRNYLR